MLQYRNRHLFADVLLSFVYWVPPLSPSAPKKGYAPAPSSCPEEDTCLHISNHLATPLDGVCALAVRDYKTGSSKLTKAFQGTSGPAGGADVFSHRTAKLLAEAGCVSADECYFTASCEQLGHSVGGASAQPFFPGGSNSINGGPGGSLAAADLTPAEIRVEFNDTEIFSGSHAVVARISMTLLANTTVPYVFVSSTVAGTFDDNTFLLRPGAPVRLTFLPKAPCSVADFKVATKVYSMNNFEPMPLG